MKTYIAVDLGGTNVRAAIVDEEGTILTSSKTQSEVSKGYEYVIEKIYSLIESLDGYEKAQGIGIGSPGPLDPIKGVILSPVNLPGWDNVPLADLMSIHFDKPCFVNNDANVAGLAEATVGAGKEFGIVQYITVSTGIGGGLVMNGQVVNGATFNAGEIGNVIVDTHDSYQYSYLNVGSVEGLASGTGITRRAIEHGIEAKHAGHLFESDKEIAIQIKQESAVYIARLMSSISHIVDPHCFVFGGGVINDQNDLFDLIKVEYEKLIYPQMRGCIHIKKAALEEPGLVGAAMLVKSLL